MIKKQFWTENTSHLARHNLLSTAKTHHAGHQVPLSLEAWKTKRSSLIRQIRENMGTIPEPCPLDVKEYGKIELQTCTIKKISYQSRPGFRVTANLYLPKGKGPFPGILVPHGHTRGGKVSPVVQSRCLLFADNGFVALAVDAFGSGERGTCPGKFEYHGANIGLSLMNIGETLLGMQLNDNMRGIDLLQSLDVADSDRIGVTGASGGGNQTMWVSAMDERVKASVPVVSVGTFESYVTDCNCVCELLPNGLTFTEEWGVLGLIAPNAVLMLNSTQDTRPFSVNEMLRSYTAAREVFNLYGAGDRIGYQAINLPHGYWPEMQRHALGWFRRWLKNEGEGRACEITETPTLPYEQLLVFPDNKRPKEVKSIYEFSQPAASALVTRHSQDKAPVSVSGKVSELEKLLRVPKANISAKSCSIRQMKEGKIDVKCVQIEVDAGVLLPLEIYSRAGTKSSSALLVVNHEGMKSIPREKWMMDLLGEGNSVIFADLSNTGTMLWDRDEERFLALPYYHNASRSILWVGRTMIGEWTRDLITIAKHVKAECGIKHLDLLAYKDAGIAALSAAVLSDLFDTVTTNETIGSYVPEQCYFGQSMAVHVPKILHWGDVSMMAVLAKAEVRLLNPTRTGGKIYSSKEIAALEKELVKIARRIGAKNHVAVQTGSLAKLFKQKT
ncbi:MAG TPA: hypothetical protein DET40_06975 [Lentisphaeria bacterium]|nr:MAG: hypothetical protein A2X45_07325 [Lentisphaerae bacterium GWF2_50_93]HCE43273.1 hypothetical protein [Lentisphaeria bacterium]